MSKKNSNSLKCRQCAMINWATDEYCRRCHQLRGRPSGESGSTPNRTNLYLAIFIAGLVIPVLVSMVDPMLGDHLGSFFVVGAIGLIVATKFLLIYEMFKLSVLWGLCGILFAPISTLVFIVSHWDRAKGKIFLNMAAILYIVIMIVGVGHLTKPNVAQNTTNPPSASSTKSSAPTPAPQTDYPKQSKNEPKKKISGK